jgi:hypothetical protein
MLRALFSFEYLLPALGQFLVVIPTTNIFEFLSTVWTAPGLNFAVIGAGVVIFKLERSPQKADLRFFGTDVL